MKDDTLIDLVEKLGCFYKEDSGPFPYDDIRTLCQKTHQRWIDLVPDLDTYFSDISGYSAWKHKILEWPDEKVQTVRLYLAKTFYDQHPKYLPLEPKITPDDTPALYADMILHEKMRQTLLALLDELSKQRQAQTLQAVA